MLLDRSRTLAVLAAVALVWTVGGERGSCGQELQADPAVRPAAPSKPAERRVLQGGVVTLEQAIARDGDAVNWYAWYMACREYLTQTGGFQCAVGSQVRFFRSGRMETDSADPACRFSVMSKRFALPKGTRINALTLPVRAGAAPPATPEEIWRRTGGE